MNTTTLLKSITKTTPRLRGTRIEDLVSADKRRQLLVFAGRKLSKPMDSATAQRLAQQRVRHIKWARA